MPNTLYTIGYAGRSLPDLAALLEAREITHLVDVRHSPRSRAPQWNQAPLSRGLAESGIVYSHCSALGNLNYRSPEKGRLIIKTGIPYCNCGQKRGAPERVTLATAERR